jgi:dTDP-4-dehydrorhamnose 3,5-epimerase-like enzyme
VEAELTPLASVVVIHHTAFHDEWGFFFEAWRANEFAHAGLWRVYVQDNQSRSVKARYEDCAGSGARRKRS